MMMMVVVMAHISNVPAFAGRKFQVSGSNFGIHMHSDRALKHTHSSESALIG